METLHKADGLLVIAGAQVLPVEKLLKTAILISDVNLMNEPAHFFQQVDMFEMSFLENLIIFRNVVGGKSRRTNGGGYGWAFAMKKFSPQFDGLGTCMDGGNASAKMVFSLEHCDIATHANQGAGAVERQFPPMTTTLFMMRHRIFFYAAWLRRLMRAVPGLIRQMRYRTTAMLTISKMVSNVLNFRAR